MSVAPKRVSYVVLAVAVRIGAAAFTFDLPAGSSEIRIREP